MTWEYVLLDSEIWESSGFFIGGRISGSIFMEDYIQLGILIGGLYTG